MIIRPLPTIFALLLTATCALFLTTGHAAAQAINTNQVGPQTFHKRIELPKAIGRSAFNQNNNEDSYVFTNDRHKDRHDRRKNRRDRRDVTQAEDTRTRAQNVDTDTHLGRREKQSRANTTRNRLEQQAKGHSAKQGVNN